LIGRLVGKVVEESADGTAVLDVRGVGYELTVPLGALGRAAGLSSEEGAAITVWVHTHVREDAFVLYGFATREDRAVFRQLIAVSNIGPKIALSILGALTIGELGSAVASGETSKLTRVPGVGKKTAERIVLELKDKLLAAPPALATSAPVKAAPRGAKADLLHGALTRMGYKPGEADRAVTTLGARVETEALSDLLREALAVLSP
jgi:holliday junction DNA helicase RuvA